MQQNRVFEVIEGERTYQDRKWGPIDQRPHEVGAWLTLMRVHLASAEAAWAANAGDHQALSELRKVLAIGTACAEQHGLPARWRAQPCERMRNDVRPVTAAAAPRFVKAFEGAASSHVAVEDTHTGLMWEVASGGTISANWKNAEAYCRNLRLLGFSDWRLPTVEELFALADRTRKDPAIDADAFPGTQSSWYWSSSPCAGSPEFAWYVDFYLGGSGCYHRVNEGFVRAVRGPSPRSSQ